MDLRLFNTFKNPTESLYLMFLCYYFHFRKENKRKTMHLSVESHEREKYMDRREYLFSKAFNLWLVLMSN